MLSMLFIITLTFIIGFFGFNGLVIGYKDWFEMVFGKKRMVIFYRILRNEK